MTSPIAVCVERCDKGKKFEKLEFRKIIEILEDFLDSPGISDHLRSDNEISIE